MSLLFNKTAVLGVGLLGGSFALAIKEQNLSKIISGFGRREANLKKAKRKGIIDSYTLDASLAVKDADLIVFATPSGTFTEIASRIKPALEENSIQMDLGSVKGNIVYELEKILPRFVGCHPIAGGENSGIDSARADLFNKARCIISRTNSTDKAAFDKIFSLWKKLGARVQEMEPALHDRIYALLSHLPHILAYALVNTVGRVDPDYLEFAGPGFRDTTRIAQSSPELWKDICLLNRDNILESLGLFKEEMSKLESYLKSGRMAELEETFSLARKLRKSIEQGRA